MKTQLSFYYVPGDDAERDRLHENIHMLCLEAGLFYQPGLKICTAGKRLLTAGRCRQSDKEIAV